MFVKGYISSLGYYPNSITIQITYQDNIKLHHNIKYIQAEPVLMKGVRSGLSYYPINGLQLRLSYKWSQHGWLNKQ